MTVNVDQLSTEVIAEGGGDAPASGSGEQQPQEQEAKMAALLARIVRDRKRTAARGFDD